MYILFKNIWLYIQDLQDIGEIGESKPSDIDLAAGNNNFYDYETTSSPSHWLSSVSK